MRKFVCETCGNRHGYTEREIRRGAKKKNFGSCTKCGSSFRNQKELKN